MREINENVPIIEELSVNYLNFCVCIECDRYYFNALKKKKKRYTHTKLNKHSLNNKLIHDVITAMTSSSYDLTDTFFRHRPDDDFILKLKTSKLSEKCRARKRQPSKLHSLTKRKCVLFYLHPSAIPVTFRHF